MTTTATIELTSLDNKYELSSKESSLPAIWSAAAEEAVANASIELIESRNEKISTRRAAAIIITVAGVNFLNTMGSGILTVVFPRIALDLGISRELLLWYGSKLEATSPSPRNNSLTYQLQASFNLRV
jgi:hypothetical protein